MQSRHSRMLPNLEPSECSAGKNTPLLSLGGEDSSLSCAALAQALQRLPPSRFVCCVQPPSGLSGGGWTYAERSRWRRGQVLSSGPRSWSVTLAVMTDFSACDVMPSLLVGQCRSLAVSVGKSLPRSSVSLKLRSPDPGLLEGVGCGVAGARVGGQAPF